MPEIRIYCQICKEHIAMAELADLNAPLEPSMFKSPYPEHGFPEPFPLATEWLELFCPVCRNRAFIEPDKVMTKRPNGLEIIIDVNELRTWMEDKGYNPLKRAGYIPGHVRYLQEDQHAKKAREQKPVPVQKDADRPTETPGSNAGDDSGHTNAPDPEAALLEQILTLHAQDKKPGQIGKELGINRQKVTYLLRVHKKS